MRARSGVVGRGSELPLLLLTSLGRLPQDGAGDEFDAQLAKPVRASQLYNALVRLLADDDGAGSAAEPERLGAAGSSLRILLAEDNAVNQKVALRLLERLGYTRGCGVERVGGDRGARASAATTSC